MKTVAALMKKISEIARENGLPRPFIVGGAVRNMITGTEPVDYDITCGSAQNLVLADAVAKYFEVPIYETGAGAKKMIVDGTELDFSPHVIYHHMDSGPFESELYSRDFTINTMMVACDNGEFVDICGGLHDMENRKLRCPVSPQVTFKDPARLLRMLRHMAEGLAPDSDTEAEACAQFHNISKLHHRHAGKMINEAVRKSPAVLSWLHSKDLIKHIPMTKFIIQELARRRLLHHA
jgi:tRNA nucleotidyltransferase/poly(A) polymerase